MNELITIVVPVYNAEKYLVECINSIVGQSYENLEIILVNDGSTDSSLSICRQISEKDNRFHVIDKLNGGVSSARNLGIKNASGKYIMFLDSDDFLKKECCQVLKDAMTTKYDLVAFGMEALLNGKTALIKPNFKSKDYENQEIKSVVIDDGGVKGFLLSSACDVLFRMDVIKKNNLFFNEYVKYNEDGLFCAEYVLCSKNNVLVDFNHSYYVYRMNQNSATHIINETNEMYLKSMLEIDKTLSAYAFKDNNVERQLICRKFTKAFSKAMSISRNDIGYKHFTEVLKSSDMVLGMTKLDYSLLGFKIKVFLMLYKIRFWRVLYLLMK